jgi:type II secretion system protein D
MVLASGPPARSQAIAPMPPAGPATGAAPGSVVESYEAAGGDLNQVVALLQKQVEGRGRIFADPRTRKIVAVAPAQVQREVAAWLTQYAAAQAQAAQANDPPAIRLGPAQPVDPQQRSSQRLALRHLAWRDFEERLFRIWGGRVSAATNEAGDMARFQIQSASGQTTLEVDRRNGHVNIDAPGNTAGSWLKVLEAIDSAPPQQGHESRVVPLDKADPAMVLRAVSLIRAAMGDSPLGATRNQKTHIGQFVSMVFQPEGAQPPAAPAGQPAAQPGEAQPGVQPPAGQPGEGQPVEGQLPAGQAEAALQAIDSLRLRGNVTIEIVGDVLVIRGPREDVERVLKIIEEIERQSIETRPEVELYLLKHVDATALSEVLTAINTAALSYQGTVTVQPLKRPNAVLLVGRKENIPAVVELIQKLDRPTTPDTQIKVIQLKNMSAIDAERFVRNFFVEDPGRTTTLRTNLGTRVLSIADFRSNSLIVQASPRDLAEVTALLTKLDSTDGARNEIRVFKLRNSLAEQLAPALQEAITGVGVGGQQGQQQQQQPQGGQGGAGAQTPATMTRRATSLQLMRIDEQGRQMIESGVLSDMRIAADTRGNSLIVVGPPSAMELMATLIQQLDALPSAEAQIKVFTLTNGDATTLVEMLQNLFGQAQGGGGQAQQAVQSATGRGESTLVPLRFSVDQRTNSIIVTGNPGDLEVVRNILARLDVADLATRITTVHRLHNAPALDVATAINNLLDRQRDLNQAAPELVTPYQQIEREVLIEPEQVTNSLIISATPRYFDEVKRIVAELDRRPPMVAIQVVIAEVTLTDDEQFGIEWGLQDSLMFDRSLTSSRYAFNNATLPNDAGAASLATRESVAGQALSNLAVGRIDPTLGFGGLVLTASNESVNVLLRALEQSSRAQIISRPQVQTLDNQLAYVNVGALVPRITGGQSSTIGTFNPTVQDISVGIILEVTPRTSPDGTIVMAINATKSSVGPEETGIPVFTDPTGNVIRSPQIPLTTAQTTVSARSGQTVILGGLITKTLTESTRRIPYVADIPVLGRLFRFDTVSEQRTELLIIMTPYIMQTEEQNEWHNARESERMSWCIADLVNIHGPVGLSGNPAFNMAPSDLIFPDLDPTAPPAVPGATTPGYPPMGVPTPGVPTPATPPPPLPGLQSSPPPIDPLVPPPLVPPPPGSHGLSLPPPPVQTAPVGSGVQHSPQLPTNDLRSPNIEPVAPPPGTQANRSVYGFVAPAVYQR